MGGFGGEGGHEREMRSLSVWVPDAENAEELGLLDAEGGETKGSRVCCRKRNIFLFKRERCIAFSV